MTEIFQSKGIYENCFGIYLGGGGGGGGDREFLFPPLFVFMGQGVFNKNFGFFFFFFFLFFSSRRRHTRCREVSWAREMCIRDRSLIYK